MLLHQALLVLQVIHLSVTAVTIAVSLHFVHNLHFSDLPYYVKDGNNVPLCTCSGNADLRFGGNNCWPYGTVDFRQFTNTSIDPASGMAMAVKSGANYGMYVYEICVAFLKCTCKDPRTVPQPVYAYTPTYPPVGALGDSTHVNQFNSIVDAMNKAVPSVIPASTLATLMTPMNLIKGFYTLNGAGNLVASSGADVKSVLDLANAVSAVNDFTWNDLTVTVARSNLYTQVLTFIVGETHRFILFYQVALAQQTSALAAISATLPAQLTTTLASANTVLSYL
jgi:hypothetical protein